jgi:hypothetical protein
MTRTKSILEDVNNLHDLREALRLEAHLFGAEARAKLDALEHRWRQLEPIRREIERESSKAVDAARQIVNELAEQYRLLEKELRKN